MNLLLLKWRDCCYTNTVTLEAAAEPKQKKDQKQISKETLPTSTLASKLFSIAPHWKDPVKMGFSSSCSWSWTK